MDDADQTRLHLMRELTGTRWKLVALETAKSERNRDAILFTDAASTIQDWKGKSEQLFGYPAAEAIGKPFHFFFRWDCAEQIAGEVIDSVQEICEFFGEVPCVAKNGTVVPTEMSAKKVYNDDGLPVGLVIIHRDVTGHRRRIKALGAYHKVLENQMMQQTGKLVETNDRLKREVAERTRAEESLRRSEAKYRSLIEQNLDEIYIIQDHRFVFANQQFLEMLGYSEEELTSLKPGDTIAPGSKAFLRDRARRRKIGEAVPEQYEFQIIRKDGRILDVETHVKEIVYNGQPAYQGCIRDIAHRKRAEKAHQESEARLKGVVEHLPEGVCLLDEKRRLVLANPTAGAYLSILCPGIVPGQVFSHIGEHTIEGVLTPRENGLSHEIIAEGPPRRVFDAMGNPFGKEGSGGGWVLVMREVTRERDTLERVRQQDRLAAVGQLAAGIAHDFNNMLTVTIGYAQMLTMRPDIPDHAKKDLDNIFIQGQRAAQLIRQILDFSRQTVIERQTVDFVPFLKETAKMLERTLPESIHVAIDIAPGTYTVSASLTQLQQILTNLAINARDAMPNGGTLTVGLSHQRVEEDVPAPLPGMLPGDWIVWTVADIGVGMRQEVVNHIFEPFFTTKRRGEGTGLGLAQVYGIVKQHDGFIGVESEPGRGATFRIYLPQLAASDASFEQTRSHMPQGQGESILVVEDEKSVLNVVQAMLAELHYQVLTASSGQEALTRYDQHADEITLVITDMVMPEMDGTALFDELRQRNPDIRVVVMSGYARNSKGTAARLPPDIAGYIEKPLQLEQVAQVVHRALTGEG